MMPVLEDTFEGMQYTAGVSQFLTNVLFRTPIVRDGSIPLFVAEGDLFANDNRALVEVNDCVARLADDNHLRSITLSEMGADIVLHVHGHMHARMTMLQYQKEQWTRIRPNLRFEEVIGVDRKRTHNPAWPWNDPRYYVCTALYNL